MRGGRIPEKEKREKNRSVQLNMYREEVLISSERTHRVLVIREKLVMRGQLEVQNRICLTLLHEARLEGRTRKQKSQHNFVKV